MGFSGGTSGKEAACQRQRHKRLGSDPWVEKTPLGKGTATHSSILTWRIPRTEETGGLQSEGGKELDTTEMTLAHSLIKGHPKHLTF